MISLSFLALLMLAIGLIYHRASLLTFTSWLATGLLIGSLINGFSELIWLPFLLILIPLNIRPLRQTYISRPLFIRFKKLLPAMTETEQDAISAGTSWWETALFCGQPDWQKLHSFPNPRLTAEEQAFLDGPVEILCRMTNDWEITHIHKDLPEEIWRYLKDHRFFALIIAKQYGGLAFSAYAQSCILQKLTVVSSTLASTVAVPNSLGPAELLAHYGTKKQRDYYLPRLAKGQEIPCFALTSPEAGSDASSILDDGEVCYGHWQGQETLGIKLNWNKRYITLAPVATLLGLAFKLKDPEGLIGDNSYIGISCALVPTHLDGITIGNRHIPLNVPFQNGPTQGKDVFIPLDYLIGGTEMAGKGWIMLMECLSAGRAITLPSTATGGLKSAALTSGAYARIRHQFKMPIGKMEGLHSPLARLGGFAYLSDAACSLTCAAIDMGEKPSVISAIVKHHLTELARKGINHAMDIHGGKGICLGPNNYLANGYYASPIAITVEGANILTRSMIIFGQGLIRCHPYFIQEIKAAANPNGQKGVMLFDEALFRHMGFTLSNLSRSIWYGITAAKLTSAPCQDKTATYYKRLTRLSSNLAVLSDITMLALKGDIKRKERVSARLGDVLSQLYLASAVLKRYHNEARKPQDLILVHWCMHYLLHRAHSAIKKLLDNYPSSWLGTALKWLLFPYGLPLLEKTDILDTQVAELLMTPSQTRDRLGKNLYLAKDTNNPIGQLEETLQEVLHAEQIIAEISRKTNEKPVFANLDRIAAKALAADLISQEQSELLKRVESGRKKIISVDDFTQDQI